MESERNKNIAIQILNGYTFEQVGFVFNISGTRVRQITYKILQKITPRIDITKIKNARTHRNGLVSRIRNDRIS